MKYTLLDLTQNILSSLDGEEVNSISDNTESRQVAQIIRTAYFNLVARSNLPEHIQTFSLTSSGDSSSPVLMYRPSNVSQIYWIKYNKVDTDLVDNFQYVTILPLQQFIDMQQALDSTATEVDSLTLNDQTFLYRNDKYPEYCTIVDDVNIVFDSYDTTFDSTLQESKTWAYGRVVPSFDMNDSFIPSLDDEQFPLLLNEAKALAFFEMKQMEHPLALQEVRRQKITLQKSKATSKPSDLSLLPNFGRK